MSTSGITLSRGCPDRQECMGCEVEMMHVPRCRTCRWWVDYGPLQLGSCQARRRGGSSLIDTDSPAAILTAPDFGCVQWEAKAYE